MSEIVQIKIIIMNNDIMNNEIMKIIIFQICLHLKSIIGYTLKLQKTTRLTKVIKTILKHEKLIDR